MSLDDLAKIASNSLLLSLDRIIGPRLIKIIYLLGLGGAFLIAMSHFFATFGDGFGSGLWGLLEIAVFGLFGILLLRVLCEAMIVYFKSHGHDVDGAKTAVIPANLIDEVRDAIEDLAADDPQPVVSAKAPVKARASKAPATKAPAAKKAAPAAKK